MTDAFYKLFYPASNIALFPEFLLCSGPLEDPTMGLAFFLHREAARGNDFKLQLAEEILGCWSGFPRMRHLRRPSAAMMVLLSTQDDQFTVKDKEGKSPCMGPFQPLASKATAGISEPSLLIPHAKLF